MIRPVDSHPRKPQARPNQIIGDVSGSALRLGRGQKSLCLEEQPAFGRSLLFSGAIKLPEVSERSISFFEKLFEPLAASGESPVILRCGRRKLANRTEGSTAFSKFFSVASESRPLRRRNPGTPRVFAPRAGPRAATVGHARSPSRPARARPYQTLHHPQTRRQGPHRRLRHPGGNDRGADSRRARNAKSGAAFVQTSISRAFRVKWSLGAHRRAILPKSARAIQLAADEKDGRLHRGARRRQHHRTFRRAAGSR